MKVVKIVVYNFDKFAHNHFMGQVRRNCGEDVTSLTLCIPMLLEFKELKSRNKLHAREESDIASLPLHVHSEGQVCSRSAVVTKG